MSSLAAEKPVTLSELKDLLGGEILSGEGDIQCGRLQTDSRAVELGDLFVAYQGIEHDGRRYLLEAVERGASALVVEEALTEQVEIGVLQVSDGRSALSKAAAHFAGYPSRELLMVGITGTNGKSTTHWMVHHALSRLGKPGLRIGTLGSALFGKLLNKGAVTTPDAASIQGTLRAALRERATSCVMEVSSHALKQKRVEDIRYDAALFTNLSSDHLDYHEDMEDYFLSKKRLFELLGNRREPTAVVNLDDPYGERLVKEVEGARIFGFGRSELAEVKLTTFEQHLSGSTVTLNVSGSMYTISTEFIGSFNAYNLTAAFSVLLSLGFEPKQIAAALEQCPQVPGRLERFSYGTVSIFVDYAHTPDSLEKALTEIRRITEGDLWVLFGCGGERDKGRRFGMGRAAKSLADRIVITSDNPRREDPQHIINDILTTCPEPFSVEIDRRAAIRDAIRRLGSGDSLLIAGKGHEDYQILGDTTIHFSDQEEVLSVLHELEGESGDALPSR